ncbi:MAG: ribonuclease H family protein [Candidatus Azobacteroides sp.]|nr:ribonuclease H family protein [Candidatus Azobacteroides sp.]
MAGKKWYVVWKGLKPGIYETWSECKQQIEGFENARYKSFESQAQAEEAYRSDSRNYIGNKKTAGKYIGSSAVVLHSLSVDAACSGNPGKMEYRGVRTETGEEIFHHGPMDEATNNIGEFLALVHGLAMLKKRNSDIPIYSDSVNAIRWVKNKKCKTLLKPCKANEPVFKLISRAETWLNENSYSNPILKWETKAWGEIPADFGRK